MVAVTPLSGTVEIAYSAHCTAGVAEFFGKDPGPISTEGSGPLTFNRSDDGAMEIIDPENPKVRLQGASDANGAFNAVLAHPQFDVSVAGVVVARDDAGASLLGGGIAHAKVDSGRCSVTWNIQ